MLSECLLPHYGICVVYLVSLCHKPYSISTVSGMTLIHEAHDRTRRAMWRRSSLARTTSTCKFCGPLWRPGELAADSIRFIALLSMYPPTWLASGASDEEATGTSQICRKQHQLKDIIRATVY